jgi:hypothetical protein
MGRLIRHRLHKREALGCNEAERDAWRVAVENVPGIRKIVDHRSILPTMGELLFGTHETA